MNVARHSSRSVRSVRTSIVSGVVTAVATVAWLMTVSVTLMPAVSVGMVAVTVVVPAIVVDALQIVPVAVNRSRRRSVVGRSNNNNELMKLWMSSPPAPKHDVGAANPMDNMDPEQIARAQAYMEHQQNAPKIGFPTDVRSLVQYNHGFAVMSTNSKRYVR